VKHLLEYFTILLLQIIYTFQLHFLGAAAGFTFAVLILVYVPFAWQLALCCHSINLGLFITSPRRRNYMRHGLRVLGLMK
jgi:hypothetical protein